MAIDQRRYVNVISGVGGDSIVANRELIARVFTTSDLLNADGIKSFNSASDVMSYFGINSEEYNYAKRYFGFVSKNITSPRRMEFVYYNSQAIPYSMLAAKKAANLTVINELLAAYEPGTEEPPIYLLMVNLGEYSGMVEISDSEVLADVNALATLLENSIRNIPDPDVVGSVTVTNNGGRLIVSSGDDQEIGYFAVPEDNLTGAAEMLAALSLGEGNATIIAPREAQTPAEAFTNSAKESNNFGSFSFIDSLAVSDIAEVAVANAGFNNIFMFSVPFDSKATAEAIIAALGDSAPQGIGLTLISASGREEFMPMAILAATDYTATNSTQNFMYQQFDGAVAMVKTDTEADELDALSVNYYGQTQAAGQGISFYQRGVLLGSINDMGVYCNEIWLKDALTVNILNLLLASPKVPANEAGEAMVRGVMQESIDTALVNGTIIKMKTLSAVQKAYITQLAGDNNAWFKVYNDGYYLMVDIKQRDNSQSGKSEYMVSYKLIYSKGDSIKYVEGSDIMI